MKQIGTTTFNGESISIWLTKYLKGGHAIELYCDEGPYATFSVNVLTIELLADQVAVKTWLENEPLRAPMLATGLFIDTGMRVPAGHADAEIWQIKPLN